MFLKIQDTIVMKGLLFIDIETVANHATFDQLSPKNQQFWTGKARILKRNQEIDPEAIQALYVDKAAIYAEFGKVVCISIGYIQKRNQQSPKLILKSFYGTNEKLILQSFSKLIKRHFKNHNDAQICGHNIREFDCPFISRRCIINGLPIPKCINFMGKKPWEVKSLIDTLNLWKFGDYKHYISLDHLTHILSIPSPKSFMDGSQVHDYYWFKNDFESIVKYCEADVTAVAQVYLKLKGIELDNELVSVSKTRF